MRRSVTSPVRRSGDALPRHDLFRRLIGWVFAQWEPIAGGRLLLLAAGGLTTLTSPLLGLDLRTWTLLAQVTAVMAVVLAASFALPWLASAQRDRGAESGYFWAARSGPAVITAVESRQQLRVHIARLHLSPP